MPVRFHATRAVCRRRALTARVLVCGPASWFERCVSSGGSCLLRQSVWRSLTMLRSSRNCSRRRQRLSIKVWDREELFISEARNVEGELADSVEFSNEVGAVDEPGIGQFVGRSHNIRQRKVIDSGPKIGVVASIAS